MFRSNGLVLKSTDRDVKWWFNISMSHSVKSGGAYLFKFMDGVIQIIK